MTDNYKTAAAMSSDKLYEEVSALGAAIKAQTYSIHPTLVPDDDQDGEYDPDTEPRTFATSPPRKSMRKTKRKIPTRPRRGGFGSKILLRGQTKSCSTLSM
jgi:hypothetical protein